MRAFTLGILLMSTAVAGSTDADVDLTKKLQLIIAEVKLIQPGMTRGDLSKFFTTEGGLYTRRQRRYAERRCPYIKVDVEFEPVGEENTADIIAHISKPFLELTICD